MARPKLKKRICALPKNSAFIPAKVIIKRAVNMTVEEYETVRLLDYLGYNQDECAYQMQVSRATVQNIYDSARFKMADAMVNGKRLIIYGGDFEICEFSEICAQRNCTKEGCTDTCEKWNVCTCRKIKAL